MPTVEAIKDKYYQIGHPGEQWQRQQLRWGWVDGGGRGNGEFACAPAPRLLKELIGESSRVCSSLRVTLPVTWNLSRVPVTKINCDVAGAPVTRAPVTKSTTLPALSRDPTAPRCLALDTQTAPRGRVIGPQGAVGVEG